MTRSKHNKELVTSPVFLLSVGISINVFDTVSSILLINFSNLPLVEYNRLIADESGFVDIPKSIILAVILSCVYILLALLYAKSHKPEKACHNSFRQIHENKRYRAFRWGHSGLYMLIYGNFYLAFINDSYSAIVNLIGFPSMPRHIIVLLLAMFALPLYYYTYYSVMWRYLTDEAKKKYPYLEWPYKKGLLNKDNLRLT